MLRIDEAFPYVPFDRDYPGRSAELLDVVIPLVCKVSAELCEILPRADAPVPDDVRTLLLGNQSYLRGRHEPI